MGTVEEHDQPVRPLHTSFRDFLLDASASGPFAIELRAESHADLADACLCILNGELRFNICQLPTSFSLNEDIADLHKRIEQNISLSLQYACRATGSHLELSSNKISPRIYPAVERFLRCGFLFWLEACSLLQADEGAISELQSYLAWSRVSEGENSRRIMILTSIAEGIVASAPQVYISGLVFAPRNSHVRRIYGPMFSRLIGVSEQAIEDDWPAAERSLINAGKGAYQVMFSPDGSRVLSRLKDDTVRVWDAATARQIGDTFVVKHDDVTLVCLAHDGSQVVSCAKDHTIKVWDLNTGQQIGATVTTHDDWIECVALSPDGRRIVTGSHDRTVRIWDALTGRPVGEALRGHTNNVTSVAFSPDGKHIVSASWDRTVRLWDATAAPKFVQTFVGHTDNVNVVVFSPDGKHIASGSADRTIRVWDVASSQQVGQPFRGHDDHVWTVAYSADGRYLLSGSYDFAVRVWDVAKGQQFGTTLQGHDASVMSVAFSPDAKSIVSGSEDRTIRIWDSPMLEARSDKSKPSTHANGEATASPLLSDGAAGHTDWVNCVAFSPDGKRIASGSIDCTVRLWDVATCHQIGQPLKGHTAQLNCIAFSPGSKRLLSGSSDGSIRLWNVDTGEQSSQGFDGHRGHILAVAYSPDGMLAASGSQDSMIRLWNATTGESVAELQGHSGGVASVAFSPDGKLIASGSHDRTIRIWDVAMKKQLGEPLAGHEASVASIAFSPDGKHIISGSHDQTLRIWDVATRRQVGDALTEHDHGDFGAGDLVFGEVNSVAFSPDGKCFVSGSSDRTIIVWDAETWEPISESLRGHDGSVTSVAFSPDGKTIISGSADHTIRIWSVPTGDDVVTMQAEPHYEVASQLDFKRTSGWLQSGVDVCFDWIVDLVGMDQMDLPDDDDEELDLSRILWIPRHLRPLPFVFSPHHRSIVPSSQPHIAVDISGAALGEDWTELYSHVKP
ncbi:quinon protein alcohol dehydrogenase-like superfamily [Schizophyllum commune]